MNPHRSVFSLLIAIVVLSSAPLFAADSETVGSPPNIVMIISDDQAWTDYGFMGHSEIRTPHLDRLASEGALFTRGYVPGSLCRCSLASMITGLYPHQNGITSNDPPKGVDRHGMLKFIQESQTLPKMLGTRGYASLQTGKWWEGNYELGGFTHGMTHGDPMRGGRHGDEGLKIGREGMAPVREFLDANAEKPFFLWFAPMLPHEPHNPPERLLKKYAKEGVPSGIAKYHAMCEWFDEACGELLVMLEERGLTKNTLVLFAADNGWIQNENGPGFAPKSKRSPYDGGLRTPIILRWPGRIKPMRDETTPVLTLDFVPTALAACGVKSAEELPGINLMEVCERRRTNRSAIFGEIFRHDAADLDNPAASLLYRWGLEGDWKIIVPVNEAEPVELYDVMRDPFELKNVATNEAERVARMRKLVNAWWPGY